MIERVIKRDGRKTKFDINKPLEAIRESFKDIGQEFPDNLKEMIEKYFEMVDKNVCEVEEIQDMVEKFLMENNYCDCAKNYILYRQERDIARNRENKILKGMREKIDAKNIQNQNANLDERSFGGRMGEAARVATKAMALEDYMSKKSRENHENNEIYIHDLDSYASGMHNCLTIPFDDLLANGFSVKQTDVRPAGSVATAFQLLAVIFQLQSLDQFGGVSASHLDWTMVPYVRKSFWKHYKDGLKWIGHDTPVTISKPEDMGIDDNIYKSNPGVYKFAYDHLVQEIHQSVEAMFHNLNSLQSRSGNQLPFTSINFGTCTSSEGRLVIDAILDVEIEGLGKFGRTSIFPCCIFQCMKGVNQEPGEPNYDLFRKALRSTAQRLYPNYANVDWSVNAGYDRNDPTTYVSTMGALDGKEILYVKINDNEPQRMSIKELFNFCKHGRGESTPVQIFFNRPCVGGDRPGRGVINKNDIPKVPGVYAITYIPEDVTYIGSASDIHRRWAEHKCNIMKYGKIDAGLCFGDPNVNHYKIEILEETPDYAQAESKYILSIPNANPRGIKKRYYKILNRKGPRIYERPEFKHKNIGQDLINLDNIDIKVYDKGGQWTRVMHIFKNNKYNTPTMMHVYYMEDDKEYCISCTEDHPLWTGAEFTRADNIKKGDRIYRADGLALEVTDVCWHWEPVDSYDIGTVTGTFIGSDIIMHNCRTYNGFDINGMSQKKDGRGNICPVTIILPTLAAEVVIDKKQNGEQAVETFMKLLDKKIIEAKDMLIERFNWICSQSPSSAPFMYGNHTMAGYNPEEGIVSALKHGTLAVGQLGLAEALQMLIGKDHTAPEGMELAKRIEQLFNTRCKEFKEKYRLNFGVYFSPSENLCYTAMKRFRKKYGIIPNVSDREYFTNSMHVPVWKEMDPFQKIDIESQLTGYSNAGCITYVELPSSAMNNIDAMETLVKYAMNKDVPYFAVNVPNDMCMDCGWTNDIPGDTCPKCGGSNIQRLRRVTGYLSTSYKNFNHGKICETLDRVKHIKD